MGVGGGGGDGVGVDAVGGNARVLHHREHSARMSEDTGTPGSQRFSGIGLIVFNVRCVALDLFKTVSIRRWKWQAVSVKSCNDQSQIKRVSIAIPDQCRRWFRYNVHTCAIPFFRR